MHPSSALAVLAASAGAVSAACTRAKLEDATAKYLKAQAAGQPLSLLAALAAPGSSVNYTENDITVDVGKGLLGQALAVDFSRSIYDTTQCKTATELTVTNKTAYVAHVHLSFGADGNLTAVDAVVATQTDWAFNVTSQLYWTKQETWDLIPEAKRDTRAVIKAAGDAYLDSWGTAGVVVPFGAPCARLEGGFYTNKVLSPNNTCTMGMFPQPFTVGNRRYVIDEELGAVDIFNGFPWIEKSKPANFSTPSNNMFRVEEGKIRYIHEVTVCQTPHCGR